eukprot:5130049-Prorocentrum_lima.AAC.1
MSANVYSPYSHCIRTVFAVFPASAPNKKNENGTMDAWASAPRALALGAELSNKGTYIGAL